MKKIIYIIFVFALLLSCKQESKTTYLAVKLPNSTNQKLELVSIASYFQGVKKKEEFQLAETDSTGYVSFKIKDFTPGFYQVLTGSYPLLQYDIYLDLGDSIFVEQSAWKDEPYFNITGKGAEKHKPLIVDYSLFADTPAFREKLVSDRFTTEMHFKKFIDSVFNPRFKQLDLMSKEDTIITNHLKQELLFEKANKLLTHLEYRSYYMNGEFNYFIPQEEYVSILDSIDIDSHHDLNAKGNLNFAFNNLSYTIQKILSESPEMESKGENLTLRWKHITEQEPSIWNDVVALSTLRSFSFAMLEEEFFDDFSQLNQRLDSVFYDAKNKQLFDFNAQPFLKLAPGQDAPSFALPDTENNIHKLADFKGKIVYIDFWGTWCGPCIAEIPASLALHEKYKNQPVAFVNIALEGGKKEIVEWKEFVLGKSDYAQRVMEGKTYTGIHLVAENQFRNKEIADYLLSFAPTYVLIDHEGKMVNPRAPRANHISEDIELLLAKMK